MRRRANALKRGGYFPDAGSGCALPRPPATIRHFQLLGSRTHEHPHTSRSRRLRAAPRVLRRPRAAALRPLLRHYRRHMAWQTARVFFPLLSLLLVLPGTYYLTADLARTRGYATAMAGMALLLLTIGAHQGAISLPSARESFYGNESHHFAYAVAIGAIWLHGLPFVQSWLATGRARPEYATLFQLAWRNCLLVVLAAIFTGAFWLLLGLWAAALQIDRHPAVRRSVLFREIRDPGNRGRGGHRRAARRFGREPAGRVAPPVADTLQMAGAARGPDRRSVQHCVAHEVGRAVRAWTQRHRGWLAAFAGHRNIYLLNAAYEDGSGEAPYPRLLGTLVRLSVPLLAAIAILATWALGLRIADYGLTVQRVWGLLVALIALSYSLGYAWAAFRPGAWMARMGSVNVCVALGTAVVLALMLTPVLSPSRLVAASQRRASWPAIRALKTASSSWASSRTGTVARALEHLRRRAHRDPTPPTCATAPRPRSRRRPSGNYAPS